MQYLGGHSGSAGKLLGTITEQGPTYTPTPRPFAATAPAHAPAPTAAAAAAAAMRRSSVSAFLQGQQDLLTTITDGVPYASGISTVLAAGNDAVASYARNSTFSNSSTLPAHTVARISTNSAGSEGSAGQAAAGSGGSPNSRHTAVKEALHARMSSAGEAPCWKHLVHSTVHSIERNAWSQDWL
jgi:hypothetical protein